MSNTEFPCSESPSMSWIRRPLGEMCSRAALVECERGATVTVISGGDSGLLGMAGPMLRSAAEIGGSAAADEILLLPGISGWQYASGVLGAPFNGGVVALPLCLDTLEESVLMVRLDRICASDLPVAVYMLRHNGEFYPEVYVSDEPATAITARRQGFLCRAMATYRPAGTPCFLLTGLPRSDRVEEGSLVTLCDLLGRAQEDSLLVVLGDHWQRIGRRVTAVTW